MSCVALVVAAGRGERAPGAVPKQYRTLAGQPVLRRAVLNCLACDAVDRVQVVIDPEHRGLYEDAVRGLFLGTPIPGGSSRQRSVHLGLEALVRLSPDTVLIHDAARPLASPALIARVAEGLGRASGCVPSLPVRDSLRRVERGRIVAEVPREHVHRVQTPQGFHFAEILAAHRRMRATSFTDDGALALAAGLEVVTVPGEAANLKLTTGEDFILAERLLGECRRRYRTAFGYDVHAFAAGGTLRLCGVEIPDSPGLAGHSDADVALHAVTDALLGLVGAGDIGSHFPPSDDRWKDADSALFLRHGRDLVRRAGGRIEHVDVTLVCERPRIAPHRQAMRERLASLLDIAVECVSVKATTSEGLGFAGRGEGMVAQAVATASFPEVPHVG